MVNLENANKPVFAYRLIHRTMEEFKELLALKFLQIFSYRTVYTSVGTLNDPPTDWLRICHSPSVPLRAQHSLCLPSTMTTDCVYQYYIANSLVKLD